MDLNLPFLVSHHILPPVDNLVKQFSKPLHIPLAPSPNLYK